MIFIGFSLLSFLFEDTSLRRSPVIGSFLDMTYYYCIRLFLSLTYCSQYFVFYSVSYKLTIMLKFTQRFTLGLGEVFFLSRLVPRIRLLLFLRSDSPKSYRNPKALFSVTLERTVSFWSNLCLSNVLKHRSKPDPIEG